MSRWERIQELMRIGLGVKFRLLGSRLFAMMASVSRWLYISSRNSRGRSKKGKICLVFCCVVIIFGLLAGVAAGSRVAVVDVRTQANRDFVECCCTIVR